MGASELRILLEEFVAVDFKRSRFTMKWNESESEVVYSDPAIRTGMSQSNHLRASNANQDYPQNMTLKTILLPNYLAVCMFSFSDLFPQIVLRTKGFLQ